MSLKSEHDPLLTRAEVAGKFGVDPKTVSRWATTDMLPSIRTPGGNRRYRQSEVQALLDTFLDGCPS